MTGKTVNVQVDRVQAAIDMAEAINNRTKAKHELLHMPMTVTGERRRALERHIERLSGG